MERQAANSWPEVNLDLAERCLSEERMLQITPDGYRLLGAIETGETAMTTFRSGNSEYIFRYHALDSMVETEAKSLEELSAKLNVGNITAGIRSVTSKLEVNDQYKEWLSGILTPDKLRSAAEDDLSSRGESHDIEEMQDCFNCRGQAGFELSCPCRGAETVLIDETDDSLTRLESDNQIDSDCQTCHGTGIMTSDCPCCAGLGQTPKYPTIILQHELTGQQVALRLDLASLIASGEIELDLIDSDQTWSATMAIKNQSLQIKIDDYISSNIERLGLDSANVGLMHGSNYMISPSERSLTIKYNQSFKQQNKQRAMPCQQERTAYDRTPSEILGSLQRNLADRLGQARARANSDRRIGLAEVWTLRPIKSAEESMVDLLRHVFDRGHTLGLQRSFIATGETGPSVYLLSPEGDILTQLSNEYTLPQAIENALLRFDKNN